MSSAGSAVWEEGAAPGIFVILSGTPSMERKQDTKPESRIVAMVKRPIDARGSIVFRDFRNRGIIR